MEQKNPSFSSQSLSSGTPRGTPIPRVDPLDKQTKAHEKNQMVGLNDKFVEFINTVCQLEQKKQALETRRKLLLEHEGYKMKTEDIVKEISADLKRKLDELTKDRKKLQGEVKKSEDDVENTRSRYDEELKKKTDLENEFIFLKKDLDESFLQKVRLELMLEELLARMDFLKRGYDEEKKELESLIQNQSVTLKPAPRNLDLEETLIVVKAQYNEMAVRSREEAEQWNQKKMDNLMLKAGKQEQDVKDIKKEIADIQRLIQRIRAELKSLNNKKENLQDEIKNSEANGDATLSGLRDQIRKLEETLHRDRKVLAEQTRDYHELLNLKLAMDIEIKTYCKILEGEEQRFLALAGNQNVPNEVKAPKTASSQESAQVAKKCLFIRIEVKDGCVISETSELL